MYKVMENGGGKILGLSLYIFIPCIVLILIVALAGALPDNMIGSLGFLMMISAVVGLIGKKLPIWNKYFGGGAMLTFMVGSGLFTYKLLPADVFDNVSTFLNKDGFLDLFITILIVGSVLSLDRKQILKAFGGFFPAIIGGVVIAFVFCMGAAALVGIKPITALINIASPIVADGNGGGAIPMSKIWAQATGKNSTIWYTPAFAVLTIANILSVILSSLVSRFGEKYPKYSGHGQLLKIKDKSAGQTEKFDAGVLDIAASFLVVLFIYIIGQFYADKISFVNRGNMGFKIHAFAFMVIFVIVLNLINVIPKEIRAGADKLQKLSSKYFLFSVMFAIGMGTDLMNIVKVFTIPNIFVIISTVLGALIGAVLVGRCFGLYPVESGITAGLCMTGMGGSGDILILSSSNRMNLMPFAQITSRIGGSMVLIVFSMLLGLGQ